MRTRKASTLTLLASLVLSAPIVAAPVSILVDDAHDTDGDELGTQFTVLQSMVVAAGHTIVEHDGLAGSLTAAVLASHDVLMVFDAETSFN